MRAPSACCANQATLRSPSSPKAIKMVTRVSPPSSASAMKAISSFTNTAFLRRRPQHRRGGRVRRRVQEWPRLPRGRARVVVRKPVVLWAGRTDTGERAARSHSGSLAGNYPVASAALQAGVILVERSDGCSRWLMVSRTAGRPTRRVAVLSEEAARLRRPSMRSPSAGSTFPPGSRNRGPSQGHHARGPALNPVDAGGGTDPHPLHAVVQPGNPCRSRRGCPADRRLFRRIRGALRRIHNRQ